MTALIPAVTDHQAAADACRAAAGGEVLIAEYPALASGQTVARMIREGLIRGYRPEGSFEASAHPAQGGTAVWARYTAGASPEPLPQTLTVRVPDYGRQIGYEGVRVLTVVISARCPVCGGPRGELRPDPFVRDGVRRERDAWSNPCGHQDDYTSVLLEAARRRELRESAVQNTAPARRRNEEIRGVDGGRFCMAVELIAAEAATWPWYSALRAIELLDKNGEHDAADAVRVFRGTSAGGSNVSAKSAALYLNHCDRQALAAATTTGDVK